MESLSLRSSMGRSPLLESRRPARPDLRPRRVGLSVFSAAVVAVEGGAPEPDLRVRVNGLEMPNPFVIASGPPGTNYTVMKRAFEEGWGAVISKTVWMESTTLP